MPLPPEIRITVEKVNSQFLAKVVRAGDKEVCRHLFDYEPGLLVDHEPGWMLEKRVPRHEWEAVKAGESEAQAQAADAKVLADYGQRLYGFLFGDGKEFASFLEYNDIYRRGARLSLCLHQKNAVALWALPWEYLHDGSGFLALDGRFLLSRLPWGLGEMSAPRTPPPLRVLVLISSPTDQAELNTEKEVAVIQDALDDERLVRVEFLDDANLPAIGDMLRRGDYHVLHYTGHGSYSRICPRCQAANAPRNLQCGKCGADVSEVPGKSYLALEDDEGQTRQADAKALLPLLRQASNLRLVVLSGCQTGRTNDLDAFSGVATGLLQADIPAVMAMQFSILDESGIELARAFYSDLAQGRTPAEALFAARLALHHRQGGPGYDWGVPALYLRASGMHLIDPRATPVVVEPMQRLDVGGLPLPRVFVGRKPELRRARQALRDRHVTGIYVRGIGGIGKSTLAAKLLERPGLGAVDDALVVRCNEISLPTDAITKVARFLEGQGLAGHAQAAALLLDTRFPMLDRARQAAQLVADRRYLLVFDNLESIMGTVDEADVWEVEDPQVRDFFRGLLEARWKSTCLFTGRYRWATFEQRPVPTSGLDLHLPGLTVRQAIMLMSNLPRLSRESLAHKREAYHRIGGHPKTIELLEGWLEGHTLRYLLYGADLGEMLSEQWEGYFLNALLSRLTAQEQDTLTRMAVFRTRFGEGEMAYVGAGAATLRRWLDLSLAQREGPELYALHPVVREYLLNRLPEEERTKLHLWAAQYYARPFVEAAKQTWGDRYDPGDETEVLKAIVQRAELSQAQGAMDMALEWHHHLFQAGRYEEAGAIVTAVWLVMHRWGQRDAAKSLLRMSIETLEGRSKAIARMNLASLLLDEGQLDAALATYQQVYKTFEALGAKAQMAAVLAQQSIIYKNKGEYDEAIEYQSRGLKLDRERGDEEGQAISLHQLSILYMLKGDYQAAMRHSQEAEALDRKRGYEASLAADLHQQGLILTDLDRPQEALARFQESLEIARRIKHEERAADSLTAIGKLLMFDGQMGAAIDCFAEALEIYRRLGNPAKVGIALEHLGIVHERQGQYAAALEKYQQAERLYRQYYPPSIPIIEQHIARVRGKQGGG